jgi:hypothetical protein
LEKGEHCAGSPLLQEISRCGFKEAISDNQLNDKPTVTPNEIFETIIVKSEKHNTQV